MWHLAQNNALRSQVPKEMDTCWWIGFPSYWEVSQSGIVLLFVVVELLFFFFVLFFFFFCKFFQWDHCSYLLSVYCVVVEWYTIICKVMRCNKVSERASKRRARLQAVSFSPSLSLSLCLCLSLSLCLCLCVCVSLSLSLFLFLSLSSLCLCLPLSVCLSVCLSLLYFFNTSSSLRCWKSGHLSWVRPSSPKSSATRFYECV